MASAIDLKWKMIRIDEDLHRDLAKVGQYGDSMGNIIRRLLDFYNSNRNPKK